ncbi:MAG: L,D-transpeptidase, partial [Muribaculaceae bacterium]|nr:L,D-transpeptidase [Muribaculaceae bacterium]
MRTKLLVIATLALAGFTACGGGDDKNKTEQPKEPVEVAGTPKDSATFYAENERRADLSKAFIVISKKDLRLFVYAPAGNDTLPIARFPVCLSKNKGQKEKGGDMRTPESPADKPFTIKQIQNASDWHHDFKDGRGDILAYGNWFLRLETPFSGIGIHGSTNNENSVPGRAS